jgi:hypothetical protein
MGLLTHDLIMQLLVRFLRHLKSLILVTDRRPQHLDLPTDAQESLVPLSDRPLQRCDLIL